MPITTDASIAQAKTTLLANRLITPLTKRNLLKQFFQADSKFLTDSGAYNMGATLSLPVVPVVTTNIKTVTSGAVTYPKQTLTNVSLVLDFVAETPFSLNDGDLTLANVNPATDILASSGRMHGNKIETQLMLSTFNDSSINGNVVGTSGATAANYKLLRTLWKAFFDTGLNDEIMKVVVLPSTMYSELLADTTVSRLVNPNTSSTLEDGIVLPTLNMTVIPANATSVGTAYTNLAALSAVVTQVGFAFSADSIIGAVRELPIVDPGLGVKQSIVRSNETNLATRLTISYNPDNGTGDTNYKMETLFGTKIYRPTTVFPIIGGVA